MYLLCPSIYAVNYTNVYVCCLGYTRLMTEVCRHLVAAQTLSPKKDNNLCLTADRMTCPNMPVT